ncbi:hypothetical protein [Nonomuraea soli]|uniref:GerMN domain-containing protein n=1 Tax=Nonomuraea soli TaxID=1032476 RepID=A0A7W0CQW6_9ACTN|nr:hypothetical protein [Nonomuraea soli]MBA2895666.1 hypothetical protein [Nonomuraea soli]
MRRRILALAATATLLAGCGIAPSDVTETGIPAPVAAIPSPKNFLVLYKGSKPYRAPIRLRDPDYDSLLTQLFADRRKGTNTALQDLTFEGSRTTPRNDGGVSPRVEEERPTTLEVYISGGRLTEAATTQIVCTAIRNYDSFLLRVEIKREADDGITVTSEGTYECATDLKATRE